MTLPGGSFVQSTWPGELARVLSLYFSRCMSGIYCAVPVYSWVTGGSAKRERSHKRYHVGDLISSFDRFEFFLSLSFFFQFTFSSDGVINHTTSRTLNLLGISEGKVPFNASFELANVVQRLFDYDAGSDEFAHQEPDEPVEDLTDDIIATSSASAASTGPESMELIHAVPSTLRRQTRKAPPPGVSVGPQATNALAIIQLRLRMLQQQNPAFQEHLVHLPEIQQAAHPVLVPNKVVALDQLLDQAPIDVQRYFRSASSSMGHLSQATQLSVAYHLTKFFATSSRTWISQSQRSEAKEGENDPTSRSIAETLLKHFRSSVDEQERTNTSSFVHCILLSSPLLSSPLSFSPSLLLSFSPSLFLSSHIFSLCVFSELVNWVQYVPDVTDQSKASQDALLLNQAVSILKQRVQVKSKLEILRLHKEFAEKVDTLPEGAKILAQQRFQYTLRSGELTKPSCLNSVHSDEIKHVQVACILNLLKGASLGASLQR